MEVFESRRSAVAVRVGLGLALLALLACTAVSLLFSGSESEQWEWMIDVVAYGGIGMIALAVCVTRAIQVRTERIVWICMSVAIGAWLIAAVGAGMTAEHHEHAAGGAEAVAAAPAHHEESAHHQESEPHEQPASHGETQEAAHTDPPGEAISEMLYLTFLIAAGLGLGLLVRSRMRPFLPSVLLDGVIVALAMTALGSAIAHSLIGTAQVPELALRLAVPLGALALLTFLVWVLAVIGWRAGRIWTMLIGGLALAGIAGAIDVAQVVAGAGSEQPLLELLWPAALLLIAMAAWQAPQPASKPKVGSRSKLLAASVAAAATLALLATDRIIGLDVLTAAICWTALAMLIVRATVAFKENIRIVSSFRREARTDFLTGLGNRRKLLGDLDRALVQASDDAPYTLAIFDLDGFKTYNDMFGHPAGDALLQRLGSNVADTVASSGIGYRLGGDEFCILVALGGLDAKRLVAKVSDALCEAGEGFTVTASCGSVAIPAEASDGSTALKIADRRMYQHKDSRRGSSTAQSRDILMQVLSEREPELREHMMDVAELARRVAVRAEMDAEQIDETVRAAELHDVGKMAVPDEILHKPSPLNDEEWNFMRRHTIVGERILAAAPALVPVGKIVRASHERWDGEGYPDHIAGEQIPLGARIVAVCDAFDAMTTDRPYSRAMDVEQALAELRAHAGSQFDPRIVELVCEELAANASAWASAA